LGLKVIGKRDDGYHNILSIFQTVDVSDELTISSGKPGLHCNNPGIPVDASNLVLKAENLFRRHHPNLPQSHIVLKKKIPIGAGLAGGSSDAAATLRCLKIYHKIPLSCSVLHEYAKELGSDVPFLIKGGTAVVSGRGEVVTEVQWPFDFTYVLVYPNFSVSTSWAYKNLGKISEEYTAYRKVTDDLKSGCLNLDDFLNALDNDFEGPVFQHYPVFCDIRTAFLLAGAQNVLLTGSGSSMLGVFLEKDRAEKCREIFEKENYEIFVVKALPQQQKTNIE
jgi:4-diphosphocytidyl-2-C-methyl-D-erythritol kinase